MPQILTGSRPLTSRSEMVNFRPDLTQTYIEIIREPTIRMGRLSLRTRSSDQ